MIIGINSTLHIDLANEIQNIETVDRRAEEANLRDFRLPLVWSRLQTYTDGKPVWNEEAVSHLDRALSALPQGVRVLGVLTSPPPYVAIQYFNDRTTLPEYFSHFVEGCIKRFPSIVEWEVWNEPNASDFFLSVKADNPAGHRPWTAREFLYDAAIPGARVIRRLSPQAKICLAGMAEDGIVGHPEKPPCLSNRLPDRPPFAEMRSKEPHGQFYFIEQFLIALVVELRAFWRFGGADRLFDAIAFHPYPYHGIHKSKEMDLVARSLRLVESFLRAVAPLKSYAPEIWVTEVGCRSLDVPDHNLWNEDRQSEFVSGFFNAKTVRRHIQRIYWYKLVDAHWDLWQEKTFGVLDHYGNPKKSFYALQRLALENAANKVTCIEDDFCYALKSGRASVNENLFFIDASTPFAYAIPATNPNGRQELMLNPGRQIGDWIRLSSKYAISISPGDRLRLKIELGRRQMFDRRQASVFGLELRIEIVDATNHEVGVAFSFDEEKNRELMLTVQARAGEEQIPLQNSIANIESFELLISEGGSKLCVLARKPEAGYAFALTGGFNLGPAYIRLVVKRCATGRSVLKICRVSARVEGNPVVAGSDQFKILDQG